MRTMNNSSAILYESDMRRLFMNKRFSQHKMVDLPLVYRNHNTREVIQSCGGFTSSFIIENPLGFGKNDIFPVHSSHSAYIFMFLDCMIVISYIYWKRTCLFNSYSSGWMLNVCICCNMAYEILWSGNIWNKGSIRVQCYSSDGLCL